MRWLPRSLRRVFAAAARPTVQGQEPLDSLDRHKLQQLLALVNDKSQPNINELVALTRNIDILSLNVKALGYQLARQLSATLPVASGTKPRKVGLGSKLSTQRDIESDWLTHWCSELKIPVFYHRKLWEFGYLLQAVYESGNLREGAHGLGFGCGTEPMASYFAAHGVHVMMTDLAPEDARSKDWAVNNEHAATLGHAHHANIVSRDRFLDRVQYRNVDMNAIPDDLTGYDFCWSVCAFEHLGSIEKGLAFVENTLKTLKPGGTAIHTTEFNINPDGPTIDNWMTVLFQRKHIETLAARLKANGHIVAKLNFDPGNQPLDRFVDLPPWNDGTMGKISEAMGQPCHLKIGIDGFVATCIGLTITKAG